MSNRQRKKIIPIVISAVVLTVIIIALTIKICSKDGGYLIKDGKISVINGIDSEPTIKVYNMFITPEEIAKETSSVTLERSDSSGRGYLNNCVFLGDSRTVAMVSFACINDDDALAQIGISHMQYKNNHFVNNAGKEYTLSSYLSSHQKPVIYVSLGVNGMNGISEEDYEKSYTELVDYIVENAPNSKVVLMSIWPVDDNGRYAKSVQNSWISKYNEFLYEMAKEKELHFLNINEILTSQSGQIKSEYDAGDGLHYNKKAYDDIMDYIISHPVPGVPCDGDYNVKYIPPRKTTSPGTENNGEEVMDDDALMQLYEQMLQGQNTSPEENVNPFMPAVNDASAPDETGVNAGEGQNADRAEENGDSSEETSGEEENQQESSDKEEDSDVDMLDEEQIMNLLKKVNGE